MALSPDDLTKLAQQFQLHASCLRHYIDEFEKFLDKFADLDLDADELSPEILSIARDLLLNNRHAWEEYRDTLLSLSERMAEIEAERPIVITEAHWQSLHRLQPPQPPAQPPAHPKRPRRPAQLPEINTTAPIARRPNSDAGQIIAMLAAALGAAALFAWLLH